MIEVITITALVTLLGWQEYQNRKERSKLFNAILSKNINDFKDLEIADKTEIKIKPPKDPNNIPLDTLTDEEWYQTEIKGKKVR
jgi:hypothetical protein